MTAKRLIFILAGLLFIVVICSNFIPHSISNESAQIAVLRSDLRQYKVQANGQFSYSGFNEFLIRFHSKPIALPISDTRKSGFYFVDIENSKIEYIE